MLTVKNKKEIKLVALLILLILLLNLVISLKKLVLVNKEKIYPFESISYDVSKALYKSWNNNGIFFQSSSSILSYLGITFSTIFDEDIKYDMNKINWNPFNTDEQLVLDSKKISFYKGVPVFRFNYNRSGSFLAIFLTRETNNRKNPEDVIRHEWGHNIQQLILGPINSFFCIFLPSWQEWSTRSYYDRPWEITADIFGGVISRKHNNSDITRGFSYLNISSKFCILSYSFLFGEY